MDKKLRDCTIQELKEQLKAFELNIKSNTIVCNIRGLGSCYRLEFSLDALLGVVIAKIYELDRKEVISYMKNSIECGFSLDDILRKEQELLKKYNINYMELL